MPLDLGDVQAACAGLLVAGEALAADDFAQVICEEDWAAVVLARVDLKRDGLQLIYERLTAAFPEMRIELRSGTRIFRGGLGFGVGRHVLAILGGKGGVGKSTTSVNLGIALGAMGYRVGVLDGDLNAPDLPHLVGLPPSQRPAGLDWDLWRQQVRPPSQWCSPQSRYGLEVTSIGFLIPEESPPVLTSRLLVSALLSHLVFEVAWTADVLLIDCPPGTGHELQVCKSCHFPGRFWSRRPRIWRSSTRGGR